MRYATILVGAVAVGLYGLVPPAVGDDRSETVESSVGFLPCTPVGVDGPVPWGVAPGHPRLPPPGGVLNLTVVITDVRPDRARLYLDDRYIGRADDFDGRPDVLYLEPGTYALEARLGGYRTARFDLIADAGCRYDIRHWLDRVRGDPVERADDGPPSPFPLERVFGPVGSTASGAETRPQDAPEATTMTARPSVVPASGRATIRLRVTPPQASVTLDGEFLATGSELGRIEGGLAVDAGHRMLEVSAPGYRTVTLALDLVAGTAAEYTVELEPAVHAPENVGD